MQTALRTVAACSRPIARRLSSLVDRQLDLPCGQRLNYVKVGQGDHVVLLMPGALGTIRSDFSPQLEGLNSKGSLTLLAWDPPGYGASTPPTRSWPTDFFHRDANMARDMMHTLGHDRYSIVGWSDGGITGLLLAILCPEAVSKLVVFGSNAYINDNDMRMVSSIRDVSKWSERMRGPMEAIYGKEYFPQLWNEWVDAYDAIHQKKQGDICKEDIQKIRCPTLIIHGDKDAVCDGEHPGFMNEHIKGSRLVRFPEGKHNLHFKYKDEFNRLVEDFLLE